MIDWHNGPRRGECIYLAYTTRPLSLPESHPMNAKADVKRQKEYQRAYRRRRRKAVAATEQTVT